LAGSGRCASALVFCGGLLLPPLLDAGETPAAGVERIHLPASADVAAVRQALADARSRLAASACQGLFTEFAGQDGRPLAAVLEGRGETGASYLDWLIFYDGAGAEPCWNRQLARFAFTVPGSPVIYVCPGFAGVLRHYSDEAVATLIHETLHSLGLGENPPSSRHIQERVLERCFPARSSKGTRIAASRSAAKR
jgi:hypothetical protein